MVQYNYGSSDLRAPKRYITTHDENGKAIFYAPTEDSEEVQLKKVNEDEVAAMHVHYVTTGFPVQVNDDQDLNAFTTKSLQGLPLSTPNGTVVRMVDLAPGAQSPMHRTQSLDYGVVLDGTVDLVLEDWDGPVRRMEMGDVSIQRGTMHAWRNTSSEKWVRMLYVLLPVATIEIGGKQLGEDYGGLELPH